MTKYKIIILLVIFVNLKINAQNSILEDNILEEYFFNINNDKFIDKIVLYKNLNSPYAFEQEHFRLSVKIFEGISATEFVLRNENNFLIPNSNENCFSEGYSHIDIEEKKFTIISQSCYDYIFLTISLEFRVKKNQIYLNKYSETYFDKSDHDKKIKPKVLTKRNFGKIKFENVNLDTFF